MKQTEWIMGLPITIEITDPEAKARDIEDVFSFFHDVDERFSTYKSESEIMLINEGKISKEHYSKEMNLILDLAEQTKLQTNGYFDIRRKDGTLEPAGIVKGWAIHEAALMLKNKGYANCYVDAGGDVQVAGKNKENKPWTIGIRNPFNRNEIIKTVALEDKGIATSGTYIRGNHIYNPFHRDQEIMDIVSLTVIGPNIYEADRFATAAFAMGNTGIKFIEQLDGFEGYMISSKGIATYTTNFLHYTGKE